MVLLNLANAPAYVTFDSLDLRNLYWTGTKSFSQVAFFNLSVSHDVTIANCWMHNWTHGTLAAGTTDALKCVIGSNSSPWNPGCLVTGCLIDGENANNSSNGTSSGEGTYAYSGNVVNTVVRNCASGFIVTGDPANHATPQIVSGCEIGPSYVSFDPGEHSDGLFMNGGNLFWWYDNFIHDCNVEAVFAGNGSGDEDTYIWNNVIWNGTTHAPIEIDTPYSGGRVYLYNNTLVGGAFSGVRVVGRPLPGGTLGTLDMRNNLVISDAAEFTIDGTAIVTTLIDQKSVLLSVASASVNGFSAANQFAPQSVNQPTFNTGTNLTEVLSSPTFLTSFAFATNGIATTFAGTADRTRRIWQQPYHDQVVAMRRLISTDLKNVAMSDLGNQSSNIAPNPESVDFIRNRVIEMDYSQATNVAVNVFSVSSAMPTAMTLVSSTYFGDLDSRPEGVLTLDSGAVLACWSQHTSFFTNGNYAIVLGVAYLPAGGSSNWITHYPLIIPGTLGSLTSIREVAMAQHPVDGSVWIFMKRDSYESIEAIRCVESGGDVTVTLFPAIISQDANGDFGPEGELPHMVALANPKLSTVNLFYQQNVESPPGTIKKSCHLAVASINPNGTLGTFLSLAQWIERNAAFGAMVNRDGTLDVGYEIITGTNFPAVSTLYDSHYNGSVWDTNTVNSHATIQLGYTQHRPGITYNDATNGVWYLLTRQFPDIDFDILGVQRPQAAEWDVGAYEFLTAPSGSPGTAAFAVADVSVPENGGFVGVSVVRGNGTLGAVSVTASTADGSAVAGHDYAATTFTASWPDGGSGARSFSVPILASGDTAATNRTFTVNLSGASGGVSIGVPSTETVTIVMNPPPPPQTTNAGTITFTTTAFTAQLTSGSVTIPVARVGSTNAAAGVSYQAVNGTATVGVDFGATSGTLSWAVNENSVKNIVVPITNTGKKGAPISFTVILSNPTGGAGLGASLASVSIQLLPVQVPVNAVLMNGKIVVRGNVAIQFK